jgi:hypothetical protein
VLHLKPQLSTFGAAAGHHAYTQGNISSSSSSGGSSSSGAYSIDGQSSVHPHQQYQQQYQQQQYPGYPEHYQQGGAEYQQEYYPDEYEETTEATAGTSRADKRRRERDIEQQLLKGDLEATDHSSLVEVRAAPQWNAHAYNVQRQQEVQIARSFGRTLNPGESLGGAPSKTASRKHQITSLVAQAAKTEMLMLDAKGHRNKTKAETAGKYGW